jgi:Holliday junction DNA helicase RuvA
VIRSVRGRLLEIGSGGLAVVEVGGVGLGLRVSETTLAGLPGAGEEVALQAHLVVREDALELYGFAGAEERDLFEALISVSGVGPRLALGICGLDQPGALRLAILRGDSATLQAASGVGKRTAERVVLELRDRLPQSDGEAVAPANGADAYRGARDGLLALGFAPDEVDAALVRVAGAADATDEELVRDALRTLRRR